MATAGDGGARRAPLRFVIEERQDRQVGRALLLLLRTSSDDDRDDRSCMSWQGGRVGGRPAADAGILRRWAVTRVVDALRALDGNRRCTGCLAGFELPAIAHSGLLARLVTRTTCKDGLDHQLGCVPERDMPAPGQHHYLRLGG